MTQVPCAFPTRTRRLLYGLLMMLCGRRQMLWLGVTKHPTAEWVVRQLIAARGWGGLRDTSSVIETASMVRYSNPVFARWEFVADQPRYDRDGGMSMRNG